MAEDEKFPMQADGDGGGNSPPDEPEGAGQSGGGAYPNPHTGKTPKPGGFSGGQTDVTQKTEPGEVK